MERALIEQAQKGDRDAFLELIATYDRQIMSVVYRFTGDCYDREDLYQEVFLRCFKSIGRFRFQAAFSTWLYRIALNCGIDFMKKKPPFVDGRKDEGADHVDYEQQERLRIVRRAARRLPGPQRICFHLFYVEDWSIADLAALLQSSEGTIKSHLDRARKKIRQDRQVLQWQTNPN